MPNPIKTLEIISCPQTVSGMWDEFEKDSNPNQFFLYMAEGIDYRVRFLGPFLSVNRVFVPRSVNMCVSRKRILEAVKNGGLDEKDVEEILENAKKKRLIGCSKKEVNEIVRFFSMKPNDYPTDANALAVNAIVQDCPVEFDNVTVGPNSVKVITLNRSLCNTLSTFGNIKISGIKARDVTIRRERPQPQRNQQENDPRVHRIQSPLHFPARGFNANRDTYGSNYDRIVVSDQGGNPLPEPTLTSSYSYGVSYGVSPFAQQEQVVPFNYVVSVAEESNLSQEQIDYVLRRGLIDIPSLLKDLNKASLGCYIYKKVKDYRMPNEFSDAILNEIAKIDENRHVENTDEHLNDVPKESFENVDRFRGSIGSLEVD